MTSCSDDGYWDKASGSDMGFTDNGKAYSFKASATNYSFEPTDNVADEVFEIPVVRNNTSGTVTLPISVKLSTDSLLVVEESVTFLDGENTAYLKITPVRDFEIGEKSSATLVIDTAAVDIPYVAFPDSTLIKKENSTEADSTEFNRQETAYETYMRELSIYKLVNKVTVSKVYTFTSLGKGYYREDCLSTFYSVENLVYQLEIEECDQIPGYYRVKNPYGEDYEYNDPGDWDKDNDYYLYIHAEDPEAVWIDRSDTGCDWGYGNFEIWSLAGLRMTNNGWTIEQCAEQGWLGTLVDGVITMPTRSLLIARGADGWYYSNVNGLFAVALPGYSIKDFSAVVAYNGRFINPADEEYILANVTLGPDVAKAWVTVVEGRDNVEGAYDLISDGTIKLMDDDYEYGSGMVYLEVTEDGEYQIPMIPGAASGKYSIVIFTFDEDGNVIDAYQDANVVSFNYTGSGEAPETWTAKFIGDYKYGEEIYFEGEDPDLTLYESDITEGRYKIEHWGADVDLIFTMAEDGELTIEEQETGSVYSSYGAVYICTANKYWSEEDYDPETDRSYYAGGKFHFNVVYYVSAGYLGYGEEVFTLTANASKERDYMPKWTAKPVNQHLAVTKRHQSKQELMKNANPERFK